jgi:DNA polymerase III alpha subunit (gram-positive type)
MSKARTSKSNELWQNYVEVMKEHNCDNMFIDILSKVLYIFGRGQAISECLYALDETNYYIG